MVTLGNERTEEPKQGFDRDNRKKMPKREAEVKTIITGKKKVTQKEGKTWRKLKMSNFGETNGKA